MESITNTQCAQGSAAILRGRSLLSRLVLFAALILAFAASSTKASAQSPGWYDVGGGWAVAVQRSDNAREYAAALTQPGTWSQRVTAIANALSEILPGAYGEALAISTRIVNYAFYAYWWTLRWRINWCANRSPLVFT